MHNESVALTVNGQRHALDLDPRVTLLDALRERGIVTLGTATTPDEAVALDDAGVDVVVASGAEAGGHRGAFLRVAEDSLVGTLPLVAIVAAEVRAPVVAAGGIAAKMAAGAEIGLGKAVGQIARSIAMTLL